MTITTGAIEPTCPGTTAPQPSTFRCGRQPSFGIELYNTPCSPGPLVSYGWLIFGSKAPLWITSSHLSHTFVRIYILVESLWQFRTLFYCCFFLSSCFYFYSSTLYQSVSLYLCFNISVSLFKTTILNIMNANILHPGLKHLI